MGSEMCIRDSTSGSEANATGRPHAKASQVTCSMCNDQLEGSIHPRTVKLTCGCHYHTGCWGKHRQQQYTAFMDHVLQYNDEELVAMTEDYR